MDLIAASQHSVVLFRHGLQFVIDAGESTRHAASRIGVAAQTYPLLFATISRRRCGFGGQGGAHLYGFPSPDCVPNAATSLLPKVTTCASRIVVRLRFARCACVAARRGGRAGGAGRDGRDAAILKP